MYGMVVNFNPGMSVAIIGLFGPGSNLARKALSESGNLIPIEAGDNTHLRVVRSYQHVGTCMSVSYDMCDEVTKRMGMMRTETSRLSTSMSMQNKTRLRALFETSVFWELLGVNKLFCLMANS